MNGPAGTGAGSLIALYRELAESGAQFHGLSILRHADEIGEVCRKHRAVTLLDYGSGRGDAYRPPHRVHLRWETHRPTRYDPAFTRFARVPTGTFDGVLCVDVLEHVEEPDVRPLIRGLFKYARSFVWASACTRPAKKCFPDGRNMHVTIRPFEWWQGEFHAVAGEFKRAESFAWYLVEST